MTRDDIIKLAREAGAGEPESLFGRTDYVVMTRSEVERFADLVTAAEREACAKECDIQASWGNVDERFGARQCSHAIRSRGQKMT